jgi:hypothetical protein
MSALSTLTAGERRAGHVMTSRLSWYGSESTWFVDHSDPGLTVASARLPSGGTQRSSRSRDASDRDVENGAAGRAEAYRSPTCRKVRHSAWVGAEAGRSQPVT